MNERQLDCAIDVAAGTLMAREPSRALGHKVMARVRKRRAITAVVRVDCGGSGFVLWPPCDSRDESDA